MKFNDLFESTSMLTEMAGGNIGLALTDVTAHISTEMRRDAPIKKIVPWLIYLAAFKVFMDNHKKLDKDHKLIISFLGAGTKFVERNNISKEIVGTVGKKKAIDKSKELMISKGGNIIVNQEVLNQWTIDLRKFVETQHKKLSDYIKTHAKETNKERAKRIDKKIADWESKRSQARKQADLARASKPIQIKR